MSGSKKYTLAQLLSMSERADIYQSLYDQIDKTSLSDTSWFYKYLDRCTITYQGSSGYKYIPEAADTLIVTNNNVYYFDNTSNILCSKSSSKRKQLVKKIKSELKNTRVITLDKYVSKANSYILDYAGNVYTVRVENSYESNLSKKYSEYARYYFMRKVAKTYKKYIDNIRVLKNYQR